MWYPSPLHECTNQLLKCTILTFNYSILLRSDWSRIFMKYSFLFIEHVERSVFKFGSMITPYSRDFDWLLSLKFKNKFFCRFKRFLIYLWESQPMCTLSSRPRIQKYIVSFSSFQFVLAPLGPYVTSLKLFLCLYQQLWGVKLWFAFLVDMFRTFVDYQFESWGFLLLHPETWVFVYFWNLYGRVFGASSQPPCLFIKTSGVCC